MDQLQNIAGALQGLGAGLQGQLPQFLATQNQKKGLQQQEELRGLEMQQIREQMTVERQKTMYVDAQSALKLAEAGNIDGVVRLGLNRLQLLKQMSQADPSIDPSDTQRITQLAIAAKNGNEEALDLLKGELASTVEVGKSIGVLVDEKPAEYTLGPGESRFSGGQQIASVPATNSGYTLSPGQTRFGPDGQSIASLPATEERAPNVREREARIQEYMENFPELDRAGAIRRLDAQYMTDPVTGNLISIDRTSGQSQVTGGTTFPSPAPGAVPESKTIFGTLENAVGAVPTTIAGFNRTFGQIFGTDQNVDRARADLRGLRENIITAFSKSGRPPVVEQQRILERFPNFGLAESVGRATESLASIYDDLMLQMQDDMRYANSQGIPIKDRQEALSRAGAISQTLSRMGTPPSISIKEITSPESIGQYDASTLKRMINNSTDEELNALPDDVYAAIQEAIQ